MRILIATDAWSPQVNGVVRTLTTLIGELRRRGHEVIEITPEGRRSLPLPFYTEVSLTRVTARENGSLRKRKTGGSISRRLLDLSGSLLHRPR
jgi:hypothetical protein